jgi:hypothetical protein
MKFSLSREVLLKPLQLVVGVVEKIGIALKEQIAYGEAAV